ncbi:uncharacterized protein LOC132558327 [Ylistrum balloti]|uniref:uncharacterized protein LOC132558327 n=1 Tax=Ylistrum balloti TaxID=509963 RepID=UPI002905A2BF|nr:uncharacterized protein LOC132558327 [Ylistrum balloti]
MFLNVILVVIWFSSSITAVPINRETFGLKCEREVSSKGDNYYVLMVFNSKIDMPCPPGTSYNKNLCDCDHASAACPYKADGHGFIENVPGFGDIYSECGSGLVFSASSCGCIKKGKMTGASTIPTTKFVCPYKRQGTGYVEDIPGLGQVWNSCGNDQLFMNAACQCVSKEYVTETDPTTKGCNNRIKEANGYKEYNDVIMDWVFYECSPSWVFRLSHCDCVDPGTNPIPPPGPPKDCTNFEVKGTGYIEHIENVGAVYNNCPPNQIFSLRKCDCTGSGGTGNTGGSNSIIRITDTNKVDCEFEAQGSGYTEYVPKVGKVFYTCLNNHRFVTGLCRCLDQDITIIDETTSNDRPKSTAHTPTAVTGTDTSVTYESVSSTSTTDGLQCKDRMKSGRGYLEYFESLNDWVFFECSSTQEFSIAECDCVPNGGAPNTKNPNADCQFEARGNGFIENIPGIGAVYSDCPSTQVFYASLCACGAPGSGKNYDVVTITDQNRVQNCAFEARGNGFVEHVIGIGLVYHDCSGTDRFISALCKCIDKDTVIIDKSTPLKTTPQPTTVTNEATSMPSTTAETPPTATVLTVTNEEKSTTPTTITTETPSTTTAPAVTNKDCIYELVPGQKREFRTQMTWMPGQYMYFSCNIGQEFDITACSCIDEKVTTTQLTINTDCPFLPSAIGDNYFRFLLFGIGWVEFSCAIGQKFDYNRCICIARP